MMILITGGAGYIGAHINKHLHRAGFRTIVYDNLVYGHREFVKWGEFVLGDLSDSQQLRLCLKKYPINVVIHLGGYAYVNESVTDPDKYYRNNLVNTLNLLDVMKECKVKWVVFSSTCSTYGIPREIPIKEDHHQSPINPYGKSKLMIEMILKDYETAYGIKYVNLRYFNAAGADPDGEIGEQHDPETHLIPLVLDAASGKRPAVKIYGIDYETPDGTCIRDYIHVSDLAEGHVAALTYLQKGGKSDSFNLGTAKGFSVREVIKSAKDITGNSIKTIEVERRSGDPPILIGSSVKAKEVLKWVPKYDCLETIMETAWQWQQKLKK